MSRTDKFQTPQGRLIWANLFQPRTTDFDNKPMEKPRYEATLMIPKLGATWDLCQNFQFFMAWVTQIVNSDFGGTYPSEHYPIKDGDAKAAADPKFNYLAGHWYITASSLYPPMLVDANNNEIVMPVMGGQAPLKSGDYVICSVDVYGYNNRQRGVSFGLEAVKKVQDGEALGGGGRAVKDIFGAPTGPAVVAAPMAMPAAAPMASPTQPLAAQMQPVAVQQGYAQPAPAPVGVPLAAPAAVAPVAYAPPAPAPIAVAPAALTPPQGHAPAQPVYPSSVPAAAPAPVAQPVAQPAGVYAQQPAQPAGPVVPGYAAPAAPPAAAPPAVPGMPPIGGH